MLAKIVVLCAVVAVAYGGLVGVASPPASTTLLANVAHVAVAQPIQHVAAVRTVAAAPAIVSPSVIAVQPQVIQTGHKIIQTVEPVEQHGYRIAY